MEECMDYIMFHLQNPDAASRFLEQIEEAICNRLDNPLSYEPYKSRHSKSTKYPYYRIYVGSYTIYYVVIEDVMEVRRILSDRRDVEWILEKE